ncbi:hypothetical protein HX089_05265 [Myroides odoratimimus]|uniref:hypothetical protein n=1 Tax=Myroides odoratimimus TaxID=76832 RepID=UPI002578EA5C|nr:hypothetical protein [Myroides odoratimimus]MDM1505373.1 hypothetical protein [Myroides odoratimimus]MDM1515800.1 hypothetical protein [Myroides odoratimimus]
MKTMLELLEEHLEKTTKEQRIEMWDNILGMNLQGPSLSEIFTDSTHVLTEKDFRKIKNDSKMTLNYSESFFF